MGAQAALVHQHRQDAELLGVRLDEDHLRADAPAAGASLVHLLDDADQTASGFDQVVAALQGVAADRIEHQVESAGAVPRGGGGEVFLRVIDHAPRA